METRDLIQHIYAAFNRRDIDAALQWMAEDVHWPKASEGGEARGKDEIRAYWTHQWAEFDPHVTPIAIQPHHQGVDVTVHQLVKDLEGTILSDQTVIHSYTLADNLITRMQIRKQHAPAFPRQNPTT